jgi:hypothetical protein
MIFGLVILMASVLVIFGVFLGCRFSEWRLGARTRRQAAVQRSLNRQWQELQVVRKRISCVGEPVAPQAIDHGRDRQFLNSTAAAHCDV